MRQEAVLINRAENLFDEIADGQDPYPISVEVHPTDVCNQACDYCFHGGRGFGRERDPEKYLSVKQIGNLMGCLSELNIKEYSISGGGEPFLSKNIGTYISEAQRRNLNTRIVTNGNFIPDDLVPMIANCKEIRFSMDTVNPETYSLIRHTNPSMLDATLINIKSILQKKNMLGTNVLVGASFITNKYNQGEIVNFADKLLGEVGVDKVIFKHDAYGKYIPESHKGEIQRSLTEVKSKWGMAAEVRNQLDKFNKGVGCVIPYFKSSINPHGDLYTCCLGAQPSETNGYLLGSLADNLNDNKVNAFKTVWKNTKTIRKQLLEGVNCVDCNYTDRIINNNFQGFKF